jgi:hypothetical protein
MSLIILEITVLEYIQKLIACKTISFEQMIFDLPRMRRNMEGIYLGAVVCLNLKF